VTPEEAKLLAARAAISLLPEHGVIGLGTGSTAKLFIDEVGALVKAGRKLVGVPTSNASRAQADALGIPLLDDDGPWDIDVCVDGADEVSEGLDLIKGGGGALTREKIVNFSAKTNVIIVDESKLSRRLGETWPVPVEVVRFGHASTAKALSRFGAPTLRLKDGAPFVTDAGGLIYDVKCGPIDDPAALERAMDGVPGVTETGLFVLRSSVVLVAGPNGVRELRLTP
jgi:ribose 5-phosphate isomerase A